MPCLFTEKEEVNKSEVQDLPSGTARDNSIV